MKPEYAELLKSKMDDASFEKIAAINNDKVSAFIAHAIELCEPDSVWVGDDSDEDVAYCRQLAIDQKEEIPLNTEGHTVHWDGYFDQARKKEVTKYLVPEGETLDSKLNQMPRDEGIKEMEDLQRGAYKGRKMLVRFFCLGPTELDLRDPVPADHGLRLRRATAKTCSTAAATRSSSASPPRTRTSSSSSTATPPAKSTSA